MSAEIALFACRRDLVSEGAGSARSAPMHFGSAIASNIYAVDLSRELARAKVYTVKH
jgi:hypothetical protein